MPDRRRPSLTSRAGRRVLVAEDNERLAALVEQALATAGYEVVVAHDGYRALALAGEQRFDALLTDWLMPGLNGDTLALRVRRAEPRLPILLMTATPERAPRQLPWSAVVAKPFELDALVRAVDAAARVAPAA